MTQLAYQTDGGVVKLLTKDGGLCTTCCATPCYNEIISSVKVNPGVTLTYTGLQGDGVAPEAGYWRLFANIPGVNGWLIDHNVVTESGRLASLWSQYTNSSLDVTYFDLTFSCDGIIYPYIYHPDIELVFTYAWTAEIVRGQYVDMTAVKASLEPYNPGVFNRWRLFSDVVWGGWPQYIDHGEYVDGGYVYNGYFQALQDSYGGPFTMRYNPSVWALAVYHT